ncbi:TMhelix containing protein [Vibrio phage 1.011.O._10N.286.49.B11]|uniref:TMhelix containing protein n=1 Tax=Vibrio phage 1.011.O._10N.286.49.B11 TaxID=1881243 RepID=A0A2I7QJR1_9VIRU|nr:TMhelix containing protein [Vibrio phage 1.011.O._10N.286.49.B11]
MVMTIYFCLGLCILYAAHRLAAAGYHGIALAFVLVLCVASHVGAVETEPESLDTSGTWLDFSEFGLPTVLEPLEGKTKIFMGDAYSYHFDRSYDYNEVHRTYGFEYKITENYAVAFTNFTNSYNKQSNALSIVYTWRDYRLDNNIGLTVGAQGGIADGYEKAKYNSNGFAPIVAPFVDITVYESIGARISVWNLYAANIAFYLEF